jgi:drug/metabolite transporter (DMT)-like permease
MYLFAYRLQSTPAGPATLMRMNDIVFAFIFGSVFLDEYPDLFSVIGSAIIVGATVAMGWRNYKSKSKK